MNNYYYIAIMINMIAFLIGNYSKWKKTFIAGKAVESMDDSEKNLVTAFSSAIVLISLAAIIFLANNILIGLVTSIALFVVINPILAGLLLNVVRSIKKTKT